MSTDTGEVIEYAVGAVCVPRTMLGTSVHPSLHASSMLEVTVHWCTFGTSLSPRSPTSRWPQERPWQNAFSLQGSTRVELSRRGLPPLRICSLHVLCSSTVRQQPHQQRLPRPSSRVPM